MNLEFNINISNNIPKYIILDEIRIRQILFNIVGNAIKFTNKGYIQINLKLLEKDIKNNTISLQIDIKDTGIGIREDQQKRIFESFIQFFLFFLKI